LLHSLCEVHSPSCLFSLPPRSPFCKKDLPTWNPLSLSFILPHTFYRFFRPFFNGSPPLAIVPSLPPPRSLFSTNRVCRVPSFRVNPFRTDFSTGIFCLGCAGSFSLFFFTLHRSSAFLEKRRLFFLFGFDSPFRVFSRELFHGVLKIIVFPQLFSFPAFTGFHGSLVLH